MSITVPLEGFGGGSNPLNFKVVGGTVQPDNPKENTIWINTDTEITSWDFSATQPYRRSRNKNLLTYPYYHTTMTDKGITFTDNGDGTVTANGTATEEARFRPAHTSIESGLIWLEPGTYTMSGGCSDDAYAQCFDNLNAITLANSGASPVTFTLTKGTSVIFSLLVKAGVEASNLVFKPQLEKGSSATSFVKGDATGQVWFTTGTASNAEFNALKKHGLMAYPISARQYIGGELVEKTALIYKNGAWVDLFLYLYKDATIYGNIVGGLNAYAYRPSSSGSDVIKPDVSMTASGITVSIKHGANGSAGSLFATRAIDVTKYKTVNLHVDNAKISDYDGFIRFGVTATRANNYVVTAAKTILNKVGNVSGETFSLDISSLTGNYYFFINLYSNGDKTITFSSWWLTP